jgi:hypothetical protein
MIGRRKRKYTRRRAPIDQPEINHWELGPEIKRAIGTLFFIKKSAQYHGTELIDDCANNTLLLMMAEPAVDLHAEDRANNRAEDIGK